MSVIERQKGCRRLDLPVVFPFTDNQEKLVVRCRRALSDRRKAKLGLNDLKVILSKMGSE